MRYNANKQAKAFLDEVEEVCRRFDISISYADGGFVLEEFEESNMRRLRSARIDICDTPGSWLIQKMKGGVK